MNTFHSLNGLTFAARLFVVASGFMLIFGLLRIVNLTHGHRQVGRRKYEAKIWTRTKVQA